MQITSRGILNFVVAGMWAFAVSGPARLFGADSDAPFVVSTLVDNAGILTTLEEPGGVAVDQFGNVYISETDRDTGTRNVIWKVTPSGTATILAGVRGMAGFRDGPSGSALFFIPEGLAVDESGTVYVGDSHNNGVRKISAGRVSTLAIGIRYAIGVAVDGAHNVYVSDWSNSLVQKITPDGEIKAVATTSSLNHPTGIALDADGNIFVTDDNTVRKISVTGVVTTLAGAPGVFGNADGQGAAARFGTLSGLAVDHSGTIYVADTSNNALRKITASGIVTTVPGGDSALIFPVGVAVDQSGAVYVVDMAKNRVRIYRPSNAPVFEVQPTSQTVNTGSTVVFTAEATGLPLPEYQWEKNGETIAGATRSTLVITSAGEKNAGTYTCVVSSSTGKETSRAANLTVTNTSNPGRLMNLSVRAKMGTDGQPLIVGFVLGGAGTSGSGEVLVRALGPTLNALGVTDALADPVLSILQGATVVASNDNWATPASNRAAVQAAGSATGAFPLPNPLSLDAALVTTLSRTSGGYSVWINGTGPGATLAELYDRTAEFSATTPRLINVSARSLVGQGSEVFIAGFVIGGTTAKTVLIRAIGPALVSFGITAGLPRPQMTLHTTQDGKDVVLATNAGWGGRPEVSTLGNTVGAFPLPSTTSADAAIVRSLPPGAYTIHVTGAQSDVGEVMIEIYDVP